MPKPMIRIHNVETGEIIDREMTEQEYKSHLADQDAYQAEKIKETESRLARATLLEKLGITAEEAKLLLG